MICPICGGDLKTCPHSLHEADTARDLAEFKVKVDNRLIELGLVDKNNTLVKSARTRWQRIRRR